MERLQRYPWPGNARELRNAVERAMIVSKGQILDVNIPRRTSSNIPTDTSLKDAERRHILAVLQNSGWHLSGPDGAAGLLGLKRTTLQSKIKNGALSLLLNDTGAMAFYRNIDVQLPFLLSLPPHR